MTTGQDSFAAALLDPDHTPPDGLGAPGQPDADRRFAVYRNNVIVALTQALGDTFPVIAKLLGPTNFRNIAGVHVRAHPPVSPLMMRYGGDFPQFLADFPPLAHLPYLADVARLEDALRLSYHAADMSPIADRDLAAIPDRDLPACRIRLVPAVHLIRSDWPVHGIWIYNRMPGAPQPPAGGQCVLITRPVFDPEMQVIPAAAATFVQQLQAGQSLGVADAAACADDPAFDLAGLLGLLLTGGAIAAVAAPGDS